MRIIEWHLDTGFSGAKHEGEIEVEDAATEEEINKEVEEAAWNFLDLWWEEKVAKEAGNEQARHI